MLKLAYRALEKGGSAGCILNAADEVAVQAFLDSRIPFRGIPHVVETTLEALASKAMQSLTAVMETDREARRVAQEAVHRIAMRTGS
jgi:1-deoxy-D-xylulose-5-phosphate reductoisomerase